MYLSNRAKKILYSDENYAMREEYHRLSGKVFPGFNYDEWESIDQWLAALTSALEELRIKKSTE